MSTNVVVKARVDQNLKDDASEIFKSLGLNLSDGIRLYLKSVVATKGIPFDLKVPNEETLKAVAAVRRGEINYCDSLDELIEK